MRCACGSIIIDIWWWFDRDAAGFVSLKQRSLAANLIEDQSSLTLITEKVLQSISRKCT